MTRQGYHAASGVILRRQISPEGDIVADIFLKEMGRCQAAAKGAGRGSVRLGGATEPLVWGNFDLYKGKGRLIIRSIEVKHDGLKLRGSERALLTAFSWVKLLMRYLEENREEDKVLTCFYWGLQLLEEGVPVEIADFRFIWRWLNAWGIAPALDDEVLIFAARGDHETIKNIKSAHDEKHFEMMRFETEKLIPLLGNML